MPAEFGRNNFLLLILASSSLALVAILSGFWKAIFWAVVFALLLRPVQDRLTQFHSTRRSLAAVLTLLAFVVLILVPTAVIATQIVDGAVSVYTQLEALEVDMAQLLDRTDAVWPGVKPFLSALGIAPETISQKASQVALKGARYLVSLIAGAGENVAGLVIQLMMMLYLLFYLLRDGDATYQLLRSYIPLPDTQKDRFLTKFAEVSRSTLKGTLVVGLVQGGLGGLIFFILGIDGAIFWAAVMAILSVLPALGATLVWAPAGIFMILGGAWIKGIVLLAYGIFVISMADNILRPALVGRETKMPDYLVLFSTIGGLGLIGLTGFVVGPVVAALFLTAWQIYGEQRNQA